MPNRTRAAQTLALILMCAGTHASSQPVAREGYVDAGSGVRLFYRLVGSGGDTLVVLHGGPGFSMSYFATDLEPLAARRVLLFYDQRGAGRSTLVSDSAGLDAQFADDLEAARKHFGMERPTLLGHSWGAAVAALNATALGAVTAPALIMHGALDGIPPETGREWAAAMPNGRFLLLEGAVTFRTSRSPTVSLRRWTHFSGPRTRGPQRRTNRWHSVPAHA